MSPTYENIEELAQVLTENPDLARVNALNKIAHNQDSKGVSAKTDTSPLPKRVKTHPEQDFQNMIIDLAYKTGWRIHAERHGKTSRTYVNKEGAEKEVWVTPIQGDPGFPDIFLAKQEGGYNVARIVVFEAKIHPNKPTQEQIIWIEMLKDAGIEARIIYPEDWDYIVKVLSK